MDELDTMNPMNPRMGVFQHESRIGCANSKFLYRALVQCPSKTSAVPQNKNTKVRNYFSYTPSSLWQFMSCANGCGLVQYGT